METKKYEDFFMIVMLQLGVWGTVSGLGHGPSRNLGYFLDSRAIPGQQIPKEFCVV